MVVIFAYLTVPTVINKHPTTCTIMKIMWRFVNFLCLIFNFLEITPKSCFYHFHTNKNKIENAALGLCAYYDMHLFISTCDHIVCRQNSKKVGLQKTLHCTYYWQGNYLWQVIKRALLSHLLFIFYLKILFHYCFWYY